MNNVKNKIANCSECNDTGFLYYGNENDFDTEVCDCAPLNSVTLETVTQENADLLVCSFCDNYVYDNFCGTCLEYKGVMTLGEWLSYTGEEWVL